MGVYLKRSRGDFSAPNAKAFFGRNDTGEGYTTNNTEVEHGQISEKDTKRDKERPAEL